VEKLFRQQADKIAAFVTEPLVQGAAGMLVHPDGYLSGLAELCRRYEVLLIADEVATGFGRTGTLFACEQENVSPDFLCLAKGLTGGYLPLAATLTTDAVFEAFLGPRDAQKTFFHGHTYTGNPLACAAAIASLDIFERDEVLARLVPRIDLFKGHLSEKLGSHPAVREIRQRGLMVGVELVSADLTDGLGDRVCRAIRRRGMILRPLGDVIVLVPPLSITSGEIEHLVVAVRDSIDECVSR
jgi:adenosylmethionine-8-amino-7-oxononanoate aminotransferase